MPPLEELPSEILRRCARAAGLIARDQPVPEALEAFGLMIALECAELADRSAGGAQGTGEPIRVLFFDQAARRSDAAGDRLPLTA